MTSRMAYYDLLRILFNQCQTRDSLTDDLRGKLNRLSHELRHRLATTVLAGVTPLCLAVKRRKLDIVEYLLGECNAYADQLCVCLLRPNFKQVKMTPLMFVKDPIIADSLIERGANLKAIADDLAPIHWQIYFENHDVIDYMMQNGADIDVQMEDNNTCLHRNFDNQSLYKQFVEVYDANVDAQNKTGQTPMHCAIIKGQLWAVKLLVENEANVTIKDNYGFDVIRLACKLRKRDIVDYLSTNEAFSVADRADIYELLGSMYAIRSKLDLAIESWRKALEIRMNNGGEFLERTTSQDVQPLTPKYIEVDEFRTVEDLDAIATNYNEILEQAFLINARILGPLKKETTDCLINICDRYVLESDLNQFFFPLFYSLHFALKNPRMYPPHKELIAHWNCLDAIVAESHSRVDGDSYNALLHLLNATCSTLVKPKTCINYFYLIALLNMMLKVPNTKKQQEFFTKYIKIMVRRRFRDKVGFSLLHYAVRRCHFCSDKQPGTLQYHPDVMKIKIFEFCRVPVINLLIEYGHEVDCLTNDGSTPLHIACYLKDVKAVECLLAHGAHVDRVNDRGIRPIHALDTIKEFDSFNCVTLKCLAAQTIVRNNLPYKHMEFPALEAFVKMH